jgi:recombinational DNA repair protein (RecF pathway)
MNKQMLTDFEEWVNSPHGPDGLKAADLVKYGGPFISDLKALFYSAYMMGVAATLAGEPLPEEYVDGPIHLKEY